jgi:hypothetical protein
MRTSIAARDTWDGSVWPSEPVPKIPALRYLVLERRKQSYKSSERKFAALGLLRFTVTLAGLGDVLYMYYDHDKFCAN